MITTDAIFFLTKFVSEMLIILSEYLVPHYFFFILFLFFFIHSFSLSFSLYFWNNFLVVLLFRLNCKIYLFLYLMWLLLESSIFIFCFAIIQKVFSERFFKSINSLRSYRWAFGHLGCFCYFAYYE